MYAFLLGLAIFIASFGVCGADKTLEVKTSETGFQYLAYGGKPLLAYGPGDEWRMISRNDFEATRRWAKWQSDNGMNLIRAYPTSVPVSNALHPFKEKDGKWDVDAWNDEYFANMSEFFGVLAEYDIAVHLQLWQIVWFKAGPTRWTQNYLNPANNVNEWTRDYPNPRDYINAPLDSPAGRHQKEWVTRVLDSIKGHNNVWIDVINELENDRIGTLDWAKEVVGWIREWERANAQKLLVGVGMCHFNIERFRPYAEDYDILIFNELHRNQDLGAIREFRKPAVTVRSSDGSNRREDYLFLDIPSTSAEHQTRYRTLVYRSVFSGVQSVGAYWKMEVSEADYMDMEDWPRYSRALRKFWNRIEPYRADLIVDDSIINQDVTPLAYGMKSDSLYMAYLECGSHTSDNRYPASTIRISAPFEDFRVEIFDPRTGRSRLGSGIRDGGDILIEIPAFIDDQIVMVWAR